MRDAVGLVCSNREKNNNKFYIIWIDGNIVNTNWGRIGTNGRCKSYTCNSYEDAKKFADTKVNEKIKKGYRGWPIEKITSHNKLDYVCDSED